MSILYFKVFYIIFALEIFARMVVRMLNDLKTIIKTEIIKYENETKVLIKDILKDYRKCLKDKEKWSEKKKKIVENIRLCFDYLIIPENILKKIVIKDRIGYKEIQQEIAYELELLIDNDIEETRKWHKENIENLNRKIEDLEKLTNKEYGKIHVEKGSDVLFVDKDCIDEIIAQLKNSVKKVINESILPIDLDDKQKNNIFFNLNSLVEKKIMSKDCLSEYKKIVEKQQEILKKIKETYDNLVDLRYIIKTQIPNEILFALGFIEDRDILKKAKILNNILSRRTQLYIDMIQKVPDNIKEEFKKYHNKGLYMQIGSLIKYYEVSNKKSLSLNDSRCFRNHIDNLKIIYQDTKLTEIEMLPKDYTNIDIFMDLLQIKDKELAELLNISTSEFSRIKNSKDNKINALLAEKLSILFKVLAQYFNNKITIPSQNIVEGNKKVVLYFDFGHKNQIFEQYEEYYNRKAKELDLLKVNSEYTFLIDHLNLLEKNREKLKKEDFEAIQRLLRFK